MRTKDKDRQNKAFSAIIDNRHQAPDDLLVQIYTDYSKRISISF